MHLKKTVLFKRGPGQFGNGRVKVIVPSLATLLACTLAEGIVLLKRGCDLAPVIEADLLYQSSNCPILLLQGRSTSQLHGCLLILTLIFINPGKKKQKSEVLKVDVAVSVLLAVVVESRNGFGNLRGLRDLHQ